MSRVIFTFILLTSVSIVVDPAPTEVLVKGANGVEEKLKPTKFLTGFRKLGFGPKEYAFIFRDDNSTNYARGVETWLLLSQINSIQYDAGKQQIQVRLHHSNELLTGTTRYKGLNALSLEVGSKRYSSTGGKDQLIQAIRFPVTVSELLKPTDASWQVRIDQPKAMNPQRRIHNLKVLVQSGSTEALISELACHKGPPLRLNPEEIQRIDFLAIDVSRGVALEVKLKTGTERTVVVPVNENKSNLLGLLGEVSGGYEFFPWHTIRQVELVMNK